MPFKDTPLAIEVPAEGRDKPAWVKVGVIAAIGFVVGIAWPRIVGVRIGPNAPAEATASSSHAGRAPDAPPASVTKPSSSTAAAASVSAPTIAAPAALPPNITVLKGSVISCKTDAGETKKGKDCGSVTGIDALVTPRVRKIATCSGVEGQTGKLSLVVNADFASGRFWYDVGKNTQLPNVDAVSNCLKTAFHGTSAASTPHEHPRYTVAYTATFAAGEEENKHNVKTEKTPAKEPDAPQAEKAEKTEAASNGSEAQVAWEVALVRDAPKTGGLVTRLARGSKVKVGAVRDGWYQIKFGDDFANEGWVYRGAIGR